MTENQMEEMEKEFKMNYQTMSSSEDLKKFGDFYQKMFDRLRSSHNNEQGLLKAAPLAANAPTPRLNKDFKPSPFMETFIPIYDWICFDLPPGPPLIPMRYYVNLHKGGMPFLILSMMAYFNNYSLSCWVYLALHGSYGLVWLLKDFTFPDGSFERSTTLVCFLVGYFGVITPYCWGAYLLASGGAP